MRSKTALIAAALSATTGAGCYSTWDIAPGAVRELHGFREGQTREIQSEEGSDVSFTSSSEIRFRGMDGLEASAKFRAINVQGWTFTGLERERGELINSDLSRMASVQVKNFSAGKTVGLSVGLGVGVPLLITGFAFAVIASQIQY